MESFVWKEFIASDLFAREVLPSIRVHNIPSSCNVCWTISRVDVQKEKTTLRGVRNWGSRVSKSLPFVFRGVFKNVCHNSLDFGRYSLGHSQISVVFVRR